MTLLPDTLPETDPCTLQPQLGGRTHHCPLQHQNPTSCQQWQEFPSCLPSEYCLNPSVTLLPWLNGKWELVYPAWQGHCQIKWRLDTLMCLNLIPASSCMALHRIYCSSLCIWSCDLKHLACWNFKDNFSFWGFLSCDGFLIVQKWG